ncbi:MAG: MGMT family protein [bacterium]
MKNLTQSAKKTSAFQQQVFAATTSIPPGCVATYGSLAKRMGCGSSQAIGQALKNNPFAPDVPCHRVVKSDGTLGGFFGSLAPEAVQKKRRMLEREGIEFDALGRVQERFILRTWTANPPPARRTPRTSPADGGP